MKSAYRPDIDGLRAVAIFSVLAFHVFPKWMNGGFVGVDIFFVISGFLISGIILEDVIQGRFSYLDFYKRRVRRIFPALVFVLAVCLAIGLFVLPPADYKLLGKNAAAGTIFISNIFLFQQHGYFEPSSELNPLLHLWSLGIEEQFYIVWPLIAVFIYKRKSNFLFLTFAVLSFSLNILLVHGRPTAAFYLPLTRFWELMIGCFLAYLIKTKEVFVFSTHANAVRNRSVWIQPVLSWSGAILLLTAFVFGNKNAFPGWQALLPTVGAFLIISAGPSSWFNRRFLASRVMVMGGKISYPLYLWHWPLLVFAKLYQDSPLGIGSRILIVLLSVLLAWTTYKFIEMPVRFTVKKEFVKPLCYTMLALGLISVFVFKTRGLIFAYPAEIRKVAEYKFDYAAYRRDSCFLDDGAAPDVFSKECMELTDGKEPAVFLWGDSHAAALYPGLEKLNTAGNAFSLSQFTSSGCPPFVGMDIEGRENCRAINDMVMSRIKTAKPEVVILGANWLDYKEREITGGAFLETLKGLNDAGIKRVVVFGQMPVWKIDQPSVYLMVWKRLGQVSNRTRLFLDTRAAQADEMVKRAVSPFKAAFISPMESFCNEQGCLLVTEQKIPVAWDYGHLTSEGSILLIQGSKSKIVN